MNHHPGGNGTTVSVATVKGQFPNDDSTCALPMAPGFTQKQKPSSSAPVRFEDEAACFSRERCRID